MSAWSKRRCEAASACRSAAARALGGGNTNQKRTARRTHERDNELRFHAVASRNDECSGIRALRCVQRSGDLLINGLLALGPALVRLAQPVLRGRAVLLPLQQGAAVVGVAAVRFEPVGQRGVGLVLGLVVLLLLLLLAIIVIVVAVVIAALVAPSSSSPS